MRHTDEFEPIRPPVNPRQAAASTALQSYARELRAAVNAPALSPAQRAALLRGITTEPVRIERGGLVYDPAAGVSVWRAAAITAVLFEKI